MLISKGITILPGSVEGLHFVDDSPILTFDGANYDLEVTFMGDLTAPYECECILRQADVCPVNIIDSQVGSQNTSKTFQDLTAGLSYILTVRCSSGIIVRSISRTFYVPAASDDCVPYFINDGISYTGHTVGGDASAVFEWSSFGSPTGFTCSIDNGAATSCKLFNYRRVRIISP